MFTDRHYADDELHHTASPTDIVCAELELFGHRPPEGEADPRDVPEDSTIQGAVADIFDALVATMADTSLDHDLDNTSKDLIMILHGIIFVFLSIHFLYSDLNFKGFCWMAEKRKPQREEERNRHKVSYSESKERRKDMFWKDVFCSWLSQSMC